MAFRKQLTISVQGVEGVFPHKLLQSPPADAKPLRRHVHLDWRFFR
jgi:hypothetical protein